MAGSKEDTETGAFFQEHTRAGSATPLLVVSDGAAGVHRAIKEQPQGRTASASCEWARVFLGGTGKHHCPWTDDCFK
jgi:hypothetical protein